MPSPSAFDPWLAARRFGIVIDAGSSGSRLQIYSWKDARVVRYEQGQSVFNSLPKVEKGAKEGEDWVSKVEPGISTFGENPQDVGPYLAPLLAHAQKHVPPSLQHETPLFLLATAGMRLLEERERTAILEAACNFLRFHSHFKLDAQSSHGPCGSSIRVISGEEEGLFGWIAVNYLMDGFSDTADTADDRVTYGFLDMGGASTQIAFEPAKSEPKRHSDNLIDVRLRLLGGQEIYHQVFVTTWLGYGTNQARERYVGRAVSQNEVHRASQSDGRELVPDPCLPVGLVRTEQPVHTGPSTPHTRTPHTLLGTGSFEQCLEHTAPLLHKNAPCPDAPCLFNGVHVPSIDFSVSHFVGVSEYWYSSEHVFGLGGAYDVVQYERAASEFCSRTWADVVHEHEQSRALGHLGGDGEVEQDGKIIQTGKWGKEVELSRLEMQCFKAAWIVNVLHEGIGLPRIVDPGGNRTDGHGGDEVDEMAGRKGLGRPTFQSMDAVGDTAISWTLGKIVLEASNEVPAASVASPPTPGHVDPTESDYYTFLTTAPARPPFLDFDKFEDRISHRLPTSLTRHSLGISPFAILFYVFVSSTLFYILCRLRHRIRNMLRRFRRGSFKRERAELVFDAYDLEESKIAGMSNPSTPFSSAPPSPTGTGPPTHRLISQVSSTLRRALSTFRVQVHPSSALAARVPTPPHLRHTRASPAHHSPRATASTIPMFPQNGVATAFHPPISCSGSTTPTDFIHDSYPPAEPSILGLNPALSLGTFVQPRSRNSSQMNLTTLIPRTTSYSRATAGQSLPRQDP